jgi:hypothetical protein
MDTNLFKMIALLLMALTATVYVAAQGPRQNEELFQEILRQDSLLFGAFNNRDIAGFEKMFAKDLEFFHDKGGHTDYTYTIQSLERTAAQNNGLRRDLVPGTMEVYPIPAYGAIQIASHRFCHQEAGKEDCGQFSFVHVWRRSPEGWKLARVVSYGH